MTREPLPGWRDDGLLHTHVVLGDDETSGLYAWPDGAWMSYVRGKLAGEGVSGGPNALISAQLAAEDIARARATDIVTALGGTVTWPAEEPTP